MCSRASTMPITLAGTFDWPAAAMAPAPPSCSRRDTRRSSSSALSSASPSAGFSGAAAAPLATTARNATISAGPLAATSATRSPSRTPSAASRPTARSSARCSAAYDSAAPDSGTTRAGWLSDLATRRRRLAGLLAVMFGFSHSHAGRGPGVGGRDVGDHVDQVGDAGGEGPAERRGDVGWRRDQLAGAAQGAHPLVVAGAWAQVGGHVVAVDGPHRLLLQAPGRVVADDHDDW